MSSNRIKCRECSRVFAPTDLLTAPNPFDDRDIVYGCPHCKSIDSTVLLCEVRGCSGLASCGTPVQGGYAQTCGKHSPREWTADEIMAREG